LSPPVGGRRGRGSLEVAALVDVIDRAYRIRSWHGTNLRGSVRGLSAAHAAWRPRPDRHSIWELVVHCAYWKYVVWRRLTGAGRGSFGEPGSNWFRRPASETDSDVAWRADLARLDRAHRDLRAAVVRVPGARLDRALPGGRTTPRELLAGIAAHDLYHAGQIQLLKVLRQGEKG